MNRVLIWDWPTRVFHWLLAGGLLAAFLIGKNADGKGGVFGYHAIIGISIGLLLLLRLLWGFIGTKHARFGSFIFGPRAVVGYFKGIIAGQSTRHIGHNPGSSWAIYLMLLLVFVIVASGLAAANGFKGVGEVHELSVNVLVFVSIVHVLGVILHTIRHRENITVSMITGTKQADASEAIRSSRPIAAIVMVALVGFLAFDLVRNYEKAAHSTKLPLIGKTISLGERGHGEHGDRGPRRPPRED